MRGAVASAAGAQGITHFVELMREVKTYDEAIKLVEARGYALGDHKAVKLRNLTEKRGVRVGLVSPTMQAAAEADSALEEVLQVCGACCQCSSTHWAHWSWLRACSASVALLPCFHVSGRSLKESTLPSAVTENFWGGSAQCR